jgi:drug/metabolite transporter, DME family
VLGPSSPGRLLGLVLIALAATSWGTTGAVTTLLVATAGTTPLVIAAVRLWLGAIVLLAITGVSGGGLVRSRRDLGRCLGMAAFMAGYQASYFTAVTLSGIAVAALVAICSAPLGIAALAVLVLGERITGRVVAALALGVIGTACLIGGPRTATDFSLRFLVGALLALAAGAAYASYVVIAKVSLARTPPLPLAATTFALAAIILSPALVIGDAPWRQVIAGWAWLSYLGVIATGVAYAIYTIGLRSVPASAAGIVSLMEPLTATLLGVGLFGERLGTLGVVGAVLMFIAIGLLLAAPEPSPP